MRRLTRRIGLRTPVSARARIVGWLLLLVALALAASVLIAARVLLARVDARFSAELTHEGSKLRVFAARAVDPATNSGFTEVDRLLAAYLSENLPDPHETFFSVVAGRADRRSPQTPPARLDLDAAVVQRAAEATDPASWAVSTAAGRARVAVYPVHLVGDPRPAALVVVEFTADERAEAWSVVRTLAIVGFCALAAAGAVAWMVAGRVLAPVRTVRRTAEQIGETDLSRRIEVHGSDDVAQLARTFNHMLDRLELAFAGQRQFLDDAGHELRTPLTVVRGHLELMGEDPVERRQTMALVLDELDRMNRIVDDLTVLAKAGRPDFLRLGEVDLADLVIEVAAKASALGRRRWTIDAAAEQAIVGDGQRLTQALMQLLANAVAHTGDDDAIGVGSAVDGTRARLWVRDAGTGIPIADQQRIFSRFVRGHGQADRQGAGLGLAIVDSIARAHGGQVLLDSMPGHGATFTLDLPVHSPRSTPS